MFYLVVQRSKNKIRRNENNVGEQSNNQTAAAATDAPHPPVVCTYLVLTGVGAEVARLVKYKYKLQIDKSNFPLSPIHGESEQEERSII